MPVMRISIRIQTIFHCEKYFFHFPNGITVMQVVKYIWKMVGKTQLHDPQMQNKVCEMIKSLHITVYFPMIIRLNVNKTCSIRFEETIADTTELNLP